jgi:hypothetical protein
MLRSPNSKSDSGISLLFQQLDIFQQQDESLRMDAIDALVAHPATPRNALDVVTLLLYLLQSESSPKIQLFILQCALPDLVMVTRNDTHVVGKIIKALLPLFSVPSLAPMATRCLLNVFWHQPRVWPHLFEVIHNWHRGRFGDSNEMALAVLISIKCAQADIN